MQQIQIIGLSVEDLLTGVDQIVRLRMSELREEMKKEDEKEKENRYMTKNEVAKYLRISRTSVFNWMNRGLLTGHKVGGKLLFHCEEVEKAVRLTKEQKDAN